MPDNFCIHSDQHTLSYWTLKYNGPQVTYCKGKSLPPYQMNNNMFIE